MQQPQRMKIQNRSRSQRGPNSTCVDQSVPPLEAANLFAPFTTSAFAFCFAFSMPKATSPHPLKRKEHTNISCHCPLSQQHLPCYDNSKVEFLCKIDWCVFITIECYAGCHHLGSMMYLSFSASLRCGWNPCINSCVIIRCLTVVLALLVVSAS